MSRLETQVMRLCRTPVRQFWRSASSSATPKSSRKQPVLSSRHADPVEACQLMLGYRFRRVEFLREALNQSTCQRLALVGDRTLSIAMVTRFFASKAANHQWNELALASVTNQHLYFAGLKRGVHHFTNPPLSPFPEDQPKKRKRLADAVEAIVGAVFEDCMAASRTLDWGALDSVIYRLGLVPEFLVTYADRRESPIIRSKRMLPTTFFKGHQTALHDTLFEHMVINKKVQSDK